MTKSGGSWKTTVNPNATNPNARGSATFSVTARDATGKTAKSSTRSFKVTRCNFPASFNFVQWDAGPACASAFTIHVSISASDRDGLGAQSAKVVYSYTPKGGSRRTASAALAQSQVNGSTHYYTTQVDLQGLAAGSTVSAYVTLTDKYGHTDKDQRQNDVFSYTPTC
jgi:hypothetical protein